MDKKNTNIKERILQVAKYKGVSYELFLDSIGLKYSNFKGKQKSTGLNSKSIERFVSKNPEINLHWLIIGKGEMTDLRETPQNLVKEPTSNYKLKTTKEKSLQFQIDLLNEKFLEFELFKEKMLLKTELIDEWLEILNKTNKVKQ